MRLHELKSAARGKRASKRVGRGTGSGLGGNAGKDEKGQNARSGGGVKLGFEDSQMSLYRRLPKRGFTDILAKQYVSINVDRLSIFENGAEITPEVLLEGRVINKVKGGVKILGSGALKKSLAVEGCKLSKLATGKMETAGRKVEVT